MLTNFRVEIRTKIVTFFFQIHSTCKFDKVGANALIDLCEAWIFYYPIFSCSFRGTISSTKKKNSINLPKKHSIKTKTKIKWCRYSNWISHQTDKSRSAFFMCVHVMWYQIIRVNPFVWYFSFVPYKIDSFIHLHCICNDKYMNVYCNR